MKSHGDGCLNAHAFVNALCARQTALSPTIRERLLPGSTLNGEANLLIFPNLDAANIALLADNCVAVVVPPADPDPEVETPDPEAETPDPEAEAPGTDTTNTPAPAVLAPKAAVPAAKPAAAVTKTNAGYNVQTAAGGSSDTGVPVWLMALTGVFTAGAATVVWQGGRRARSTEN